MTAPARHWRHYSGTTDANGQVWVETTNPNGSYAVSAGGYAELGSSGSDEFPNSTDGRVKLIGVVPSYDSGNDTLKFLVGFGVDGNWQGVALRCHLYAIVP